MDSFDIKEALYENPVIMAIKNHKDFEKCLETDNKIVFVLYGNIETIPNIISSLKKKNKIVIIHLDLIEGLSSSNYSVSFIKKYTDADGIISTKVSNVIFAKKLGLFAVLRFFVFDSMSLGNMKESIKGINCDVIEILPGIMPGVINDISKRTNIPIVAGGLIKNKDEVIDALNAGAIAISTSNNNIWQM